MKKYKSIMLFIMIVLNIILNLPTISVRAESLSGQEIEVILNVDSAVMEQCIKNFNKKYPDVKVKYTRYSDYENKIMERINSGDYGDVLFIPASIDSKAVETYYRANQKAESGLSYKSCSISI